MPNPIPNNVGEAPLKGCFIVIVGSHYFKNALISFYLEQTGGADSAITDSIEIAQQMARDRNPDEDVVIMIDAEQPDSSDLLRLLGGDSGIRSMNLVLFDVDKSAHLETTALKLGVKGFFYTSDQLDAFPRGLRFVCQGELWVSRAILENALMGREPTRADHSQEHNLTSRELQILSLIGEGVRNADIADTLCISPHTVKTHIYNVFKKIGVSNRLQAARWADENL